MPKQKLEEVLEEVLEEISKLKPIQYTPLQPVQFPPQLHIPSNINVYQGVGTNWGEAWETETMGTTE
jgi:hypothetical protein